MTPGAVCLLHSQAAPYQLNFDVAVCIAFGEFRSGNVLLFSAFRVARNEHLIYVHFRTVGSVVDAASGCRS